MDRRTEVGGRGTLGNFVIGNLKEPRELLEQGEGKENRGNLTEWVRDEETYRTTPDKESTGPDGRSGL